MSQARATWTAMAKVIREIVPREVPRPRLTTDDQFDGPVPTPTVAFLLRRFAFHVPSQVPTAYTGNATTRIGTEVWLLIAYPLEGSIGNVSIMMTEDYQQIAAILPAPVWFNRPETRIASVTPPIADMPEEHRTADGVQLLGYIARIRFKVIHTQP